MYVETSPGAALARTVECCWTLDAPREMNHGVAPDGCLDIIYSREWGLRAVGAMTVKARFTMLAGSKTVGVRFRPGMARPFLGIPPPELTGKIAPLDELWGARARELARRLEDEPDAQSIAGALIAPPAPDPVKHAIEAIAQAHGAVDLDAAAAKAGMSARQFRRRCFEESGLAPKHLCRILRFRYASQLAARGAGRWAAIALDAGYFDQAHLIRDFREFTGQAPLGAC